MSIEIEGRTIYFNGKINNDSALELIKEMKKLENEESRDPIDLHINSEGGDAYNLLSIYDYMRTLDCNVNTYGSGICASGGGYILSFGTGKRVAYKNTRIMIHELQCSYLYQSLTDNSIRHQENKALNDVVMDIFSEAVGKDKDKVKEDVKRDMWLSATEAKEYGIVDEII